MRILRIMGIARIVRIKMIMRIRMAMFLLIMKGARQMQYQVISSRGGQDYLAGAMESYGDTILTSVSPLFSFIIFGLSLCGMIFSSICFIQLSCAVSVALYTSPLILPVAYRLNFSLFLFL